MTWEFARDAEMPKTARVMSGWHVGCCWQARLRRKGADLPFRDHPSRFSLSSTQTAVMATVSRAVLSKCVCTSLITPPTLPVLLLSLAAGL